MTKGEAIAAQLGAMGILVFLGDLVWMFAMFIYDSWDKIAALPTTVLVMMGSLIWIVFFLILSKCLSK